MASAIRITRIAAMRLGCGRSLLLAAVALALLLAGCDTLSGGAQRQAARDALWQAEVDAMQLVVLARAALQGDQAAFDEMHRSRDAIEGALGPSAPPEIVPAAVRAAWARVRNSADTVLSRQEKIQSATEARSAFDTSIPLITSQVDQAARELVAGAEKGEGKLIGEQAYLLGRSLALLGRLSRHADAIRAGDAVAISAADGLARDTKMLGTSFDGFLEGNAELGIAQIVNPEAASALRAGREHFTQLQAQAEVLLQSVQATTEAREAIDSLFGDVLELRHTLQRARAPAR